VNPALPWIVANGITSTVVASVFAYLAMQHRSLHLRLWAMGWAGVAIAEVVAGIDSLRGATLAGTLLASAVGAGVAILFYRATKAYLNQAATRAIWIAAGGSGVAVSVLWVLLHSELAFFPVLILTSGAFIVSGVLFLRVLPRSPGSILSGGALVVNGVHMLDFPILARIPDALAWGYLVAIVLEVVLSIGLIMLHYEATQRNLEHTQTELAKARRLEAIGRLATGIAHDFNNLLTVILGNVDLETDNRDSKALDHIRKAAEQASRLTEQLLAYGRSSPVRPERVDLVVVVVESIAMLRRMLPENIEIAFETNVDTLPAIADRTQLEQLVSNLLSNASDSMPKGGRIGVSFAAQGSELRLKVTDTGCGVPEGLCDRVFEPFFTTKELGRGTGLGLATVHGIVMQQNGQIELNSEDTGTCVQVRMPFEPAVAVHEDTKSATLPLTGRVLVVEDDYNVRLVTCSILRRAGNDVSEAADGQEALELILERDCTFDVVVSDVVMPRVGGLEMARVLRERDPAIQILLVSGYPGSSEELAAEIGLNVHFLTKPYLHEQLLNEVRVLLEAAHRNRRVVG
jgi:signal transduction histidine kinase/CheY-like chemotaxis protein